MKEPARRYAFREEVPRSQAGHLPADPRPHRDPEGYSSRVWASAVLALVLFWCILSCITFLVVRRDLPSRDSADSELLAFSSWQSEQLELAPDFIGKGELCCQAIYSSDAQSALPLVHDPTVHQTSQPYHTSACDHEFVHVVPASKSLMWCRDQHQQFDSIQPRVAICRSLPATWEQAVSRCCHC